MKDETKIYLEQVTNDIEAFFGKSEDFTAEELSEQRSKELEQVIGNIFILANEVNKKFADQDQELVYSFERITTEISAVDFDKPGIGLEYLASSIHKIAKESLTETDNPAEAIL